MSNSRRNPQNALLRLLARKKAVSADELRENALEAISEVQDGAHKPDFANASLDKPKYAINRAMKNMLESGFAESLSNGAQDYLRITAEGRKKLASLELSSGTLPLPAQWDGRWRMIILDLPEDRKSEREALRYLLKKAGFACVKNTVWVSPYPFEHLFINLKKDLGLSTEMIVLTTDSIDEETEQKFLNQK